MGDLGKIIVATGFEWLPKVQKITQSGHTDKVHLLLFAENCKSYIIYGHSWRYKRLQG